jgi:hypothetical protein
MLNKYYHFFQGIFSLKKGELSKLPNFFSNAIIGKKYLRWIQHRDVTGFFFGIRISYRTRSKSNVIDCN